MNDLENTVYYLLGFAGTGKYTIAKALAERTGARVVDNHHILNPIFSLIAQDGKTPLPPQVWAFAWQVHHAVYGTIRTLSPPNWSFVFTNGLIHGDPEAETLYRDVLSVAEARAARFVPVRLLCDAPELARRNGTPSRRERFKEVDPEAALERHARFEVYKPDHPNALSLDVTRLSPDEAASAILEHARHLGL